MKNIVICGLIAVVILCSGVFAEMGNKTLSARHAVALSVEGQRRARQSIVVARPPPI